MYKDESQELARQKREQEALAEHARLSKLFKEDPAAFEIERRRLIVGAIAQCMDSKRKKRLEKSQKEFDRIMRGAGSDVNRFNMAQAPFWHKVINEFLPMLQTFQNITPQNKQNKKSQVHLRLCK